MLNSGEPSTCGLSRVQGDDGLGESLPGKVMKLAQLGSVVLARLFHSERAAERQLRSSQVQPHAPGGREDAYNPVSASRIVPVKAV